jgi:hypothetical protein
MPKVLRLLLRSIVAAVAFIVAVPAAWIAWHVGLSFLRPVHDVSVPLPVASAIAHVEVWGNTTSDGRFELLVENGYGEARHTLWEDWGPAQRVSLYLTPKGWLVALGGGGMDQMFDLQPDLPPRWVEDADRWAGDGADWTYIGAVDRAADSLRFYSAAEQAECVPMFGVGESPYRKAHQAEGFCGL